MPRLVTPVDRLEVPATVQAVLAARIDHLPEREKRLLQVASVIGKDFLAAVAELPTEELKAALAALRRAEFVHEQALYPVAEYAFKHPLTQEVALDSQLKERRRQVHAAVGRRSRSAGARCEAITKPMPTGSWRARSSAATEWRPAMPPKPRFPARPP